MKKLTRVRNNSLCPGCGACYNAHHRWCLSGDIGAKQIHDLTNTETPRQEEIREFWAELHAIADAQSY